MKNPILPITSVYLVESIVAELAAIQPAENGLVLQETAPSTSVRQVIDGTEASRLLGPGPAA